VISPNRWSVSLLLTFSLASVGQPTHAAMFDFLLGKKADATEAPEPTRRSWPVGQFTSVELVAREADAPDNLHPANWSPDLLRRQLGAVRASTIDGPVPLFAADELDTLVVPLSQALALAKPKDDILLLSTNRRGGAFFLAPTGVTARLFVADGNLQLIVHDARLDFYNTYIGSRVEPKFTYGSRSKAGSATLQSESATSRRSDWLSISPVAAAAPATAATAPAAVPQPVAAPMPAAGAASAPAAKAAVMAAPATEAQTSRAPAPTVPPAAARPRDPGFADEVEQRLLTLKRLFDRGLISEAEYQQKRKEVLQLL
jgi:hypothetical protein